MAFDTIRVLLYEVGLQQANFNYSAIQENNLNKLKTGNNKS